MQAILASHMPVFPSVYKDPDVLKANPWFADALPVVEGAKSRPVSAQYPQVSDAIRSNMNAYLAGTKTTDVALCRHEEPADAPIVCAEPREARRWQPRRRRSRSAGPLRARARRVAAARRAALLLLVVVVSDRDAVLEQPAQRRPARTRGGRTFGRASRTTRARSTTTASGIRRGTPCSVHRRHGARRAGRRTRSRAPRQQAVHASSGRCASACCCHGRCRWCSPA